ncbi:YqhA family protein [Ancylobacter lacus]|uniref:YqhA family protein n=1 Tax=Ancylobacter lacus TaxID=2579970 RepID=UPI001BCABEBF|nr:YqhA family protein [Ancylobacter lacus]MBS7540086.1 YqhA family protein [Ancylobacter lacus]
MRTLVIRAVVLCRWAMVPFFLGLVLALGLLLIAFFGEIVQLALRLHELNEVELIMALLSLIDLTLVAGLLVIIIHSGFQNFVERIDGETLSGSPAWMSGISFSGLKMKLFASLMAIAGITLLKALMKLEVSVSTAQVQWLVVANVLFVAAYTVLALTDRLTRQDAGGAGETPSAGD